MKRPPMPLPVPVMRFALLLAALLLPGLAPAEVLNYDYVYLSRNGTESDGHGTAGGYKSLGQYTHVFLSVDDTAFYAGSHDNWDYDLKTWRIGAGGHYMIGARTMVAPALSVFHSEGTVLAPSWLAPHRLNGNGYIAEVDLRHAVNDHVELVAAARRTEFQGERWNELVGGVMFHANAKWAFGALYHRREQKNSTEFTVRYYY
jgi:hypothetical protein